MVNAPQPQPTTSAQSLNTMLQTIEDGTEVLQSVMQAFEDFLKHNSPGNGFVSPSLSRPAAD